VIRNSIVPVRSVRILPTECRQRGDTYKGLLEARLSWEVDGNPQPPMAIELGEIPVMVRSKACHLSGMSPEELVAAGEDEDCWGGFFVIKGHERLIRMLVHTRKNYPISLQRSTWKNRGPLFTDKGIVMRSVSEDLRSVVSKWI
jgi:DNA-directed RNA polymerase I subunit RPA2